MIIHIYNLLYKVKNCMPTFASIMGIILPPSFFMSCYIIAALLLNYEQINILKAAGISIIPIVFSIGTAFLAQLIHRDYNAFPKQTNKTHS